MIRNINKKKVLKYAIYLLLVILFFFYLKFSNNIFASLAGSELAADDFENYQQSTATGQAHFDTFTIGEDIFQISYLGGWAFCDTKEDNENRSSTLLFVSEDNTTYSIDAQLNERADARSVYSELLPANSTLKLGVMASFSPIIMKPGIYDLYVYCWENDHDYGLINTGKKFIKQGSSFKEYVFQSEEIPSLAPNEDLPYSRVDTASALGSSIEISGWAFIENTGCDQQDVYIRLTNDSFDKTYTTEQKTRTDVAEAYENDLYIQSGFTAMIPADQLETGSSYSLEIILENGEQIASKGHGGIIIHGDGIVTYGNVTTEPALFSSQKAAQLVANEKLTYYSVDIVSALDSFVEITGWALLEGVDSSQQEVYVQLTGGSGSQTYTTEQKTRMDVAKAYENELYTQSGYTAKIPVDQLEPGSYSLEIFVKFEDRIASVANGTVQLLEDGTVSYTR